MARPSTYSLRTDASEQLFDLEKIPGRRLTLPPTQHVRRSSPCGARLVAQFEEEDRESIGS